MKRRADRPFPSASTTDAPAAGISRRALLAALPALGASGCIGSFAGTNRLLEWNSSIGNKWVNWLVFLVLFIIPVYPILFGLVDLFVINSIEFWTGKAPFASRTTPDGGRMVTEKTEDPNVAHLAHYNPEGQLVAEMFVRRIDDDTFELLDAERVHLATVQGKGEASMRDASGKELARLNRGQLRQVRRALEVGASPAETTWNLLEDNGQQEKMLAFADHAQRRVMI